MKTVFRSLNVVAGAAMMYSLSACTDKKVEERHRIAEELRQDSVTMLRSELAEEAMQASMFVNEVNKALAKARSLNQNQKQLLTTSELADVNEERNAALARVTQLVEQLDAARGRIYGLHKQVADKDTALAQQMAQFETSLSDANASAERQRAELQAVIDSQTAHIASLTNQVDTLTGRVGQLTSEVNAVYVVSGTREELVKKGVLVSEGPRRFGIVGRKTLIPSRAVDVTQFTRLDRRSDTTIFLPDGVYKIMSRQNGSFALPQQYAKGGIVGGLTIEDPEKFWNSSSFLILVKV
ncbi:MAG TPA: hypothetical protein VKH19_01155 [Gemmatimonadaceae bacterium]|nr:hypothetical protein [Gemmatimonadaceae bacterium]